MNELVEMCECGHKKENHAEVTDTDLISLLTYCQVCMYFHEFKLDNLKSVDASKGENI